MLFHDVRKMIQSLTWAKTLGNTLKKNLVWTLFHFKISMFVCKCENSLQNYTGCRRWQGKSVFYQPKDCALFYYLLTHIQTLTNSIRYIL